MPDLIPPRPEKITALIPIKDVVLRSGGGFVATSAEPWLGLRPAGGIPGSRFVKLRYSTGPTDPPGRPLLRIWRGRDRFRDVILHWPTEGEGVWFGRTPSDLTDIWISPTNCVGSFDFEIVSIEAATIYEIARLGLASPKRSFFALAAELVGLEAEADLNWRWVLGRKPLVSAPCSGGEGQEGRYGPKGGSDEQAREEIRFVFVVDVGGARPEMIDATCNSIQRQCYGNWHVTLAGTPHGGKWPRNWSGRPKFSRIDFDGLGDCDLVARLRAGDEIREGGLACIAAHFSRRPECDLAYVDEARHTAGRCIPFCKPGWSPVLQRSVNYIGYAVFFRPHLLPREPDWLNLAPDELADRLALGAKPHAVDAIHRPLISLVEPPARPIRRFDAVYRTSAPRVSVIIPTRDKAKLLDECLQSVFSVTSFENFEVTLVDNGSVEARTHAVMRKWQASQERLAIIQRPGPFNFSALCNAGRAASSGEFLLFLNNDTRVLTPDWIERLLYFATQDDIGAVGAKLLLPDGKTQHVGVLLGMGGVAGHFGAGLDAAAPGWLGRNQIPHEVSAVTGACLMVETRKFDAIGGFDEKNLPVDLNDVDLCLRLSERNWRTICNTQAVLVHRQSASRGGGLRLQSVYERERGYFLERWRSLVRNDPYFHPALSLYANEEMPPESPARKGQSSVKARFAAETE